MRRLYVWLSVAIGLALFSILVVTADWRGALTLLQRANPEFLLLYIAVTGIIFFLKTVSWRVIAKSRGFNIDFSTSLSYRLSSFAIGFVTPGPLLGGDAVGAGLIIRHKKHDTKKISYGEAFSTLAIVRMVELQTFAVLFFIGVLVLAVRGNIPSAVKVPLILIACVFLGAMALFFLGAFNGKFMLTHVLKRFTKSNRILKEINIFEQTLVTFYRREPRAFLVTHFFAMLAWCMSLVEYYALLRALGFDPSLYMIFVVYGFVGIAYAIPVPLALGTLETAQTAAFGILGLPVVGGVLLAFITRIRDLVITAIGFILLMYHGIVPSPPQKTVRT